MVPAVFYERSLVWKKQHTNFDVEFLPDEGGQQKESEMTQQPMYHLYLKALSSSSKLRKSLVIE